ncbi:MAG: hypothetical protein ABSD49_15305 [Candidatus Bathyarchaeia archaeon]|jgi:hypothetical protein
MSKNAPNKKPKYRNYVKAVIILGIFVIASYWAYWSYSQPSRQSTIPTTQTSTISQIMSLQNSDFNLTNSNTCAFVNKTTGETELLFILYVSNRFNTPVHYINESEVGFLISATSGQKLASVPFNFSLRSPTYTDKLVVWLSVPLNRFPKGIPLLLSISLDLNVAEVKESILLLQMIPLSAAYPTCSV